MAAKNGIMTCIDGLPNLFGLFSGPKPANRKITPSSSLPLPWMMILLQFEDVVVPEKLDLNVKSWRLIVESLITWGGIPTFLMFYCLVGHNFQDTAWNRRYQYAQRSYKFFTSCSCSSSPHWKWVVPELGLKECKGRSHLWSAATIGMVSNDYSKHLKTMIISHIQLVSYTMKRCYIIGQATFCTPEICMAGSTCWDRL